MLESTLNIQKSTYLNRKQSDEDKNGQKVRIQKHRYEIGGENGIKYETTGDY